MTIAILSAFKQEQACLLDLLKKQCPDADYFMSDPDFTLLAIRERH